MNQLSIGIISYNEEKNITNILNSIKWQYLGKFSLKEIIISDDSDDNTPFLIKEFIKNNSQFLIRLFHHNKRRGASSGWNEIFREATGDYLVLYDADVILEKQTTYNLVNGFSSEIGLCAGNPQPIKIYNIYGRTEWRAFRRQIRAISLLAVGLVLFTTVLVAWAAHEWIGLAWGPAFVLGAIVSPPDAVAATAITRGCGCRGSSHDPRRREPGERRHGPGGVPGGGRRNGRGSVFDLGGGRAVRAGEPSAGSASE